MSARLTMVQIEILVAIKNKNDSGDYCDIYDLMDKLSYRPSRTALAHSIAILENKGFIERLPRVKRPGRAVTVVPFDLTTFGHEHFEMK